MWWVWAVPPWTSGGSKALQWALGRSGPGLTPDPQALFVPWGTTQVGWAVVKTGVLLGREDWGLKQP